MSVQKVSDAMITALSASKLTGTVVDSQIDGLNASKLTGSLPGGMAPETDLSSVRSDILKLALHQAIDGNRVAYNLDDSFVDGFEDSSGLTTLTDVIRDTTNEYVSSSGYGSPVTIFGPLSGSAAGSGFNNYQYRQLLQSHTATFQQLRATVTTTNAGDVSNAGIGQRTGSYGDTVDTPVEFLWGGTSGASGVSQLSDWLTFTMTNGVEYIWTMKQGNHTNAFYSSSPPSGDGSNANGSAGYDWNVADVTDQSVNQARSYFLMKMEGRSLTVNATGTLISDPQTASTSRTSASGVIIYEDAAGTSTLGTDLKIYFSCDNSTWTEAASYGTSTTYSGTKKLVKLGATTCTAGTSIAMKAEWANQAATGAGSYVTGNRASTITVTSDLSISGGAITTLVDGTISTGGGFYPSSAGFNPAGKYIQFQFSTAQTITAVKFHTQNNTEDLGVWKWQGSNDASSWTDVSGNVTLGDATTDTMSLTNSTAYVYYRALGVSGSGDATWCYEMEFEHAGATGKEARLHGWAVNY